MITCDSDKQDISKVHTVNLALHQHCFKEDDISSILANTTFQQMVKITVPSFKIYKHKMHDIEANDKAIDLNLKQVIKRRK